MARPKRPRFGFGRVSLARFRRSVRGRAAWLVEDMRGGDGLPDLLPVRDRSGDDALEALEWLPVYGARRPDPTGTDRASERSGGSARPGGAVATSARGQVGGGPVPAQDDRARRADATRDAHVPSRDQDDGFRDDLGDGPRPGFPVRSRTDAAWSRPVPAGDAAGDGEDEWDEDGGPAALEPYVEADRSGRWSTAGGRPLAPAWMRHPWLTIRRRLAFELHRLLFQVLHTPDHLARALRWAPRGLHREVTRLVRWAVDAEARELRWSAIARDDVREYLHLSRQRNQRLHNRVPVAIALVVVIGVVVAVAWWYALVTRVAVVLLVVGLLGWRGSPADTRYLEPATVPPHVVRVTGELLVSAFAAAGLCSLDVDRAPGPIRFVTQVAVDGPGTKAVIELPPGKTASQAIAAREKIAAGLDVDEFRVFLSRLRGTTGSARRVEVWVADKDPYEESSSTSMLGKAKSWDFWRGFPFGVDARGKLVVVPLVWSSLLIGAIPRMGKTNAARIAAAAAALDPHVRLIVFDGKGGKDWKPFEACAHFYASGVRLVVVEALLALLRDAVGDMNRRYEAMQDLPDDVCPEGKVTPYITRRRGYGMPLTLVCVDEVHRYLEHPEHGATICALLTELVKAGPAAGYMLVLATQRPDTKAVPESLRGQMGTRFALRTMTWQASETILGAGTYSAGLDSSRFLPAHKGVGILRGAGDETELGDAEAITVRTHRLDLRHLRGIGSRGRQLRISTGTLTGTAAGEAAIEDGPKRRLLDDILDVFEPAEDRMWSETICLRLAARWPEVYDGWDPTTLANVLRPFEIETKQQWGRTSDGAGVNRRGVTRQQLLDAIAAREQKTIDARAVAEAGIPAGERPQLPGSSRRAGRGRLAGEPASSSTPDIASDQGPSG